MNKYQQWMQINVYTPVKGKCKYWSEYMVSIFPELRLVRGYYIDIFGTKHPHWWTEFEGNVYDPTVSQFLLGGMYEEYTGPEPTGRCLGCGALLLSFGNFCSKECESDTRASMGLE